MQNNAFTPFGPTYLVSTTPVQVLSTNNLCPTAYRVRNTSGSANTFSWYPPLASGQAPAGFTASSTAAGTPAVNTITMLGTSVEVFQIPGNAWFVASAASLEVTPGEGI